MYRPAWLCIREPRRNAQTLRQTGGGGGGQKAAGATAPPFFARLISRTHPLPVRTDVSPREENFFFSLFLMSEGVWLSVWCLILNRKIIHPHVSFVSMLAHSPLVYSSELSLLVSQEFILRNNHLFYFISKFSLFFFNHLLQTNNSCVSWLTFFFFVGQCSGAWSKCS